VRDRVRPAVAAVTFLTALPIGRGMETGARDLRSGLVLFPAVGALIGAATGAVAWGAAFILPSFPAAVMGVASGVLLTGAMHLDGIADTADGVGAALGGKDPMTAMHDPHLGTFGGAVLTLDLLLKISVFSALIAGPRFPAEAVAAGALGRAAAIGLVAAIPYAGSASGAGGWTRDIGLGPCLAGIAMASSIGLLAVGPMLGVMVATGVVVAGIIGRWSRRSLGGVTGDTLGATAELTETLSLTVTLAFT
jgi:adenosylcobinamide-GDP ribazoletransferase